MRGVAVAALFFAGSCTLLFAPGDPGGGSNDGDGGSGDGGQIDSAGGPCEREVMELGGTCERAINRRTDYVVIGALAAHDWSQSAFGKLVDEVVQYRSRGVRIAVITEEHWAAALP